MTKIQNCNLLRKQMDELLKCEIEEEIKALGDPDRGTDENAGYQIQMMRKTQRMLETAMDLMEQEMSSLDEIDRKLSMIINKG